MSCTLKEMQNLPNMYGKKGENMFVVDLENVSIWEETIKPNS